MLAFEWHLCTLHHKLLISMSGDSLVWMVLLCWLRCWCIFPCLTSLRLSIGLAHLPPTSARTRLSELAAPAWRCNSYAAMIFFVTLVDSTVRLGEAHQLGVSCLRLPGEVFCRVLSPCWNCSLPFFCHFVFLTFVALRCPRIPLLFCWSLQALHATTSREAVMTLLHAGNAAANELKVLFAAGVGEIVRELAIPPPPPFAPPPPPPFAPPPPAGDGYTADPGLLMNTRNRWDWRDQCFSSFEHDTACVCT